ncbi:MAG TPA: galactokinase [Pyrinomonadaceae bacterium]|jgi:galactokinase
MIDLDALERAFERLYDSRPRLFSAPGRVNLIGEHTDYNDGFVLPMAINRRTVVAASARTDRRVRAMTRNLNETAAFDLDQKGTPRRQHWLDYVEGVARALEESGLHLGGADLLLESDVPVGAGLSSSAALEVSVGLALVSVMGAEIDRVRLALAGQRAEHIYVGAQVGIMDQFVAALGQRGHALLIDCRSLESRLVPLNIDDTSVVICDTGVKHELATSEYNTRRAECERGVEILRERWPGIAALRDVTLTEFQNFEQHLPEPIRRRCRHVITENARTLAFADALRSGGLEEMGRLMALSHRSLRDDYEVSCHELDVMVEIATSFKEATVGARMTGGGFGGCTVNLVRRDHLEEFQKVIRREYGRATGIDPPIYVVEADDGAQEIG